METFLFARGQYAISDITTFDVPSPKTMRQDRRRSIGADHIESALAQHFEQLKLDTFPWKHAKDEKIQRTQPQARIERTQSLERPQEMQPSDAFRNTQPWETVETQTQARIKPRRTEPADIWDLFKDDADYSVSLVGSPPPPSILSTRRGGSSQSTTSYPPSEKTLEFSDFDESSKTTNSHRLEHARASTKADKELLDRLLQLETQRLPQLD